jgi:hypothetical protein
LQKYIVESDAYGFDDNLASWVALRNLGWIGHIPKEQRNYYRKRYESIYPSITLKQSTEKLVRYFAGSWARVQLHGSGADDSWGSNYIRVTFVIPIPGISERLTGRNIYYRTLPMKYAVTHIPPWRAKGYLKLNGQVTPKLASWHEPKEYQRAVLSFKNGDDEVKVQADFVVCD